MVQFNIATMNKIFQLITIAFMSAIVPLLSSCKDDDSVNEWDINYVSLLPADYLRPTPSFSLKHVEEEGIEGNVDFQFMAKTQKAVDQDIKVNIRATCDGISTDKISLTSKELVIKAGSTVSEPITLNIKDWKELESTKGAANYTLKIKITDIESVVEVANATYYQEINLKITKAAERKKQNVLLTNAKDWIFTFMDGVENPGSNSVAGTGSSDVATNGVPFWFTVDFKEVKTLTGIQTKHWGSGYAPSKIELFTSENGRDWTTMGQMDTKGGTQTITFENQVKTRYLKYQMINVPGRVDITKFNVYSWE